MLKGKNIVVTGCNKGIGFAILRTCAENHANIYACIRTKSETIEDDILNLHKQYDVDIHIVPIDLSSEDSIKQLC